MKKLLYILILFFSQCQQAAIAQDSSLVYGQGPKLWLDSIHSTAWFQDIVSTFHYDFYSVFISDTVSTIFGPADSLKYLNGKQVPVDTMLWFQPRENLSNPYFQPVIDSASQTSYYPQFRVMLITTVKKKQ